MDNHQHQIPGLWVLVDLGVLAVPRFRLAHTSAHVTA